MFARPYATMYYVTDMKAAVAFYTETLGFGVRFQEDGWSELTLGGQALALHGAEKAPAKGEHVPHLILEVADIETTVSALKEKRVEFVQEINEIGGGCGFCATMLDPAGNQVGLYQAAAH